jgi:hypothetical protein
MLLAAGACSDGEESLGPAGTVGPAPTTTSTTARPIDPAVIPEDPADIDEPYVQAVVDALFEVDAKATKIFVETKAPDEQAISYLEAIFIGEELDQQINAWFQDLALRPEQLLSGTLRHSVQQIIASAPGCVFFTAERDFSETTTNDAPLSLTYLALAPKGEGDDSEGLNPTAWMVFSDSISLDGPETENPCAES